jgi:colicin import membrane protein
MRARVVLPFGFAALLLAGQGQAQLPDGPQAERLIAEASSNPRAASDASETGKSREALERARGTRASGDGRHGQLLEKLALVWAEAAREILTAIDAEEKAQAAQRKMSETKEQIERERALLEENIARRSRAQIELRRAQEEAASRPAAPPPKEKKGKGGKKGGKK